MKFNFIVYLMNRWLSPLALNLDFPIQIRSIGLLDWSSKGLSDFSGLVISESLRSFEQIREFNILPVDFFKYLQIRHFTESLLRQNKFCLNLSELEETMISTKSVKGIISRFYGVFLSLWFFEAIVGTGPGDIIQFSRLD